jgi:hypothetical protein
LIKRINGSLNGGNLAAHNASTQVTQCRLDGNRLEATTGSQQLGDRCALASDDATSHGFNFG